jgi:methionyl aminopeptidase
MGIHLTGANRIPKKSRHDLKLMREAGIIVAKVHALMRDMAKEGVNTLALDEAAEALIRGEGALPTFKGYHGFPFTICSSVNDEVVHGFPSRERILKEGDIISVDVGATYRGMVADAALTIAVGQVAPEHLRLMECTEGALYAAIAQAVPGNHLNDVSTAVERFNDAYNFGLVKEYGGHSVGHKLHEEPFIHNYDTGSPGPLLEVGNCLAIEPMFVGGEAKVKTLADGWTVVTEDGAFAAHFEHTITLVDGEALILTRLPENHMV